MERLNSFEASVDDVVRMQILEATRNTNSLKEKLHWSVALFPKVGQTHECQSLSRIASKIPMSIAIVVQGSN